MTSQEIREKFLKFFEERGHVIVPSSSLIPDDPSVLLTTAGMQQFKPYYTGELDPMTAIHGALGRPIGSKNAVSIQKSFRTSDIDEVGDESHLTFFEMLGNFSFGGYFKEKAIPLSFEFITSEEGMGLDPKKLFVTAFKGDSEVPRDDEAISLWQEQFKNVGIDAKIDERIFLYGREKNWWEAGLGPAGPDAEMFYDLGVPHDLKFGPRCHPNCDCGRFIEIGNDVFVQYDKTNEGVYEPLAQKGIDNGRGFERLIMVIEGKKNVFETSLFEPILKNIPEGDEKARRIIADHMRASVFLIADGVRPSNVERGYILRRLLRRAARYAYLSLPPDYLIESSGWYDKILKSIIENYREAYPAIINCEAIYSVVATEVEKFSKALDKGLKEIEKFVDQEGISAFVPNKNATELQRLYPPVLLGQKIFDWYQNYGFPKEFSIEELKKYGIRITKEAEDSILEEFKKHQEISRAGLDKKFGGHGLQNLSAEEIRKDPVAWKKTRLHTATHLLHRALRNILGEKVRQMGSDINEERTRFDFAFDRKLTPEELHKIEQEVNQKIAEDLEVIKAEMPYQKAIEEGATAFFKEKYPEIVSVYSIVDKSGEAYSKELCGGPHVNRTSEIGRFKIAKEEAVSARVRRIRGIIE